MVTVMILCVVMETIGSGLFPVHLEHRLLANETLLHALPTTLP